MHQFALLRQAAAVGLATEFDPAVERREQRLLFFREICNDRPDSVRLKQKEAIRFAHRRFGRRKVSPEAR
jgi:hypothetical protein